MIESTSQNKSKEMQPYDIHDFFEGPKGKRKTPQLTLIVPIDDELLSNSLCTIHIHRSTSYSNVKRVDLSAQNIRMKAKECHLIEEGSEKNQEEEKNGGFFISFGGKYICVREFISELFKLAKPEMTLCRTVHDYVKREYLYINSAFSFYEYHCRYLKKLFNSLITRYPTASPGLFFNNKEEQAKNQRRLEVIKTVSQGILDLIEHEKIIFLHKGHVKKLENFINPHIQAIEDDHKKISKLGELLITESRLSKALKEYITFLHKLVGINQGYGYYNNLAIDTDYGEISPDPYYKDYHYAASDPKPASDSDDPDFDLVLNFT